MLDIISADPSHISEIKAITLEVWPQTYTPIVGAAQVQYMLDRFYSRESLSNQMKDQQHQFILLYSEGKASGFASFSELEGGVYKLHKLYVAKGMQGRGIGRAMTDHIVAKLRQLSATALSVNVNRYNTPAIKFYEQYGFEHVLTEDIDIGNGYFMNDFVLQLSI